MASLVFASGLIPHVPEIVDVVSGVTFLTGLGIAGAQLIRLSPATTEQLTTTNAGATAGADG